MTSSCPTDEFRAWHESVVSQYPEPVRGELTIAREKWIQKNMQDACCRKLDTAGN
jgi:hypothetical protein